MTCEGLGNWLYNKTKRPEYLFWQMDRWNELTELITKMREAVMGKQNPSFEANRLARNYFEERVAGHQLQITQHLQQGERWGILISISVVLQFAVALGCQMIA